MPRVERKISGMVEYEVVHYDPSSEAEMLAWADHINAALGGRDRFADEMRLLLKQSGYMFDERGTSARVRRECPEESAEFLANEWLVAYTRFKSASAELEAGKSTIYSVPALTDAAEQMGRFSERLWWRAGIDPATGARREQLALERRKSRLAFGSKEARDQYLEKMAPRIEAASEWKAVAQDLANSYFKRNPSATKSAAAKYVLKHWPNDGPSTRSESTIRQTIRKT